MDNRPFNAYEIRSRKYDELKVRKLKTMNFIGNLRLVVFFGGVGGTVYLYLMGLKDISIFVFLICFLLFIYLAMSHDQVSGEYKRAAALHDINAASIKRLSGDWKSFKDCGEEFIDREHPYTFDLDIFGRGSLFQCINTAVTYTGRHRLKDKLSGVTKAPQEISKVQDAVAELSEKVDFRQKLQSEGMISKATIHDPKELCQWAENVDELYLKPWAAILLITVPVCTMVTGFLSIILKIVPYYIPILLVLLEIVITALKFGDMQKSLSTAVKYEGSIRIYDSMLSIIENEKFESEYLNVLKGRLYDGKGRGAFAQIDRLSRISSNMISMRNHELYIVFDILALWDYQCRIAVEKWKHHSGKQLETWLDVIGEFEALSSLALLKYDHPGWCMPEVMDMQPYLNTKAIGHPLLSEDRVCNDLKIEGRGSVLLITGSNMSGKSTLLRTCGINLILAYAGAPVCARYFSSSIMKVYSSMRISDNLEENISSFYAELLRIKKIIDAANRGEKLFFLLDEILKGTNSRDRHTGAKVLITKMSTMDAVGLVSTHDLELGALEEENYNIKNYHFQEYYDRGEIHFDYKLYPGVSNTSNAVYLMKMVGIEV